MTHQERVERIAGALGANLDYERSVFSGNRDLIPYLKAVEVLQTFAAIDAVVSATR